MAARIERVHHHYLFWEDWRAGLYRVPASHEQEDAVLAASLLGVASDLKAAMLSVLTEWPISSAVNLSHVARNRQAWLGQAACCWAIGVPETITKMGWHLVAEPLQVEANAVADEVIAEWEYRHLSQRLTEWEIYGGQEVA